MVTLIYWLSHRGDGLYRVCPCIQEHWYTIWLSHCGDGLYRVSPYMQGDWYTGCHTMVMVCIEFVLTYRDTDILAVTQWRRLAQSSSWHTATPIYWLSHSGDGLYRICLYIQGHKYTGCHTIVIVCTGFVITYMDRDILTVTQWWLLVQGSFLQTGTQIYWLSHTGYGLYRIGSYIQGHRYTAVTQWRWLYRIRYTYRATDILAVTQL